MTGWPRPGRWRPAGVAAAVALAALFVLPSVSFGGPVDRGTDTGAVSPASVTAVSVSWDTKNISSANSPANSFTIAPGQTASVLFTFSLLGGGTSIRNASLKLTYLGVVLSTTTQQTHVAVGGGGTSPIGAAIINWSFGNYYQFVEGAFQLTAGLLDANGSVVWSQSFYVHATATYSLESVLVVVLLIIGALEIYYIATSFRTARRLGRNVPEPLKEAPPVVPPAGGSTPPSSEKGSSGGGGSS